MIKFENTEVLGFDHAIRGMRNPMNSWDKSDSGPEIGVQYDYTYSEDDIPRTTKIIHKGEYIIGDHDMKLMKSLAKGGPVHAKYRRMITVYVDITAPLYWWKEFDTYKVGTVANSCSTMHKIHAKEFTLEDFSHEHLIDELYEDDDPFLLSSDGQTIISPMFNLRTTIDILNVSRNAYLACDRERQHTDLYGADKEKKVYWIRKMKKYWWQMIQLLPTSYNQKRTIMLNYEVLVNIYESRRHHKLDEWHTLCDWIQELPYSNIIIGDDRK